MNAGDQLIEQGRIEGEKKGRIEGLRAAIDAVLHARAIRITDAARDRLAACADVAVLTRWHTRAVTAASENDVFVEAPEG